MLNRKRLGRRAKIYMRLQRPLERLKALPQQIKEKVVVYEYDPKTQKNIPVGIREKKGQKEFIRETSERMSQISIPAYTGFRAFGRTNLKKIQQQIALQNLLNPLSSRQTVYEEDRNPISNYEYQKSVDNRLEELSDRQTEITDRMTHLSNEKVRSYLAQQDPAKGSGETVKGESVYRSGQGIFLEEDIDPITLQPKTELDLGEQYGVRQEEDIQQQEIEKRHALTQQLAVIEQQKAELEKRLTMSKEDELKDKAEEKKELKQEGEDAVELAEESSKELKRLGKYKVVSPEEMEEIKARKQELQQEYDERFDNIKIMKKDLSNRVSGLTTFREFINALASLDGTNKIAVSRVNKLIDKLETLYPEIDTADLNKRRINTEEYKRLTGEQSRIYAINNLPYFAQLYSDLVEGTEANKREVLSDIAKLDEFKEEHKLKSKVKKVGF